MRRVQNTDVDFLEVFVLNVSEWVEEILFDVVFHGILHLRQLSVGLTGFYQRLTFIQHMLAVHVLIIDAEYLQN